MNDMEQKAAVRRFVKTWTGRGDEKQDTQTFWLTFLRDVFGVERPEDRIKFEVPVKLDHTSFIDAYMEDTHVLIEQKGLGIDLRKGYRQSDGSMMTPFQQARRYAGYLPHNMNPRWIVVCNFGEFHIHDMNRPNDTAEVIPLAELEKEVHRLKFLVDTGSERIKREEQISLKAGDLVGKLYDALLKQYNSPASDAELKSLNMLCVRLVFCLYAEDAGIFGAPNMFHDYLRGFQPKNVRKALIDLFRVLNMNSSDRKRYDPYMDEDLAAFPYVNGGLFADDSIIVPHFTEEIIELLLSNASEDFNWSQISPTIFGAVFESTLNPETRRSGGMHYTSIENIHKVIDPLFFDELKAEWAEAKSKPVAGGSRSKAMNAFHARLSRLTFLDPACGSGNFLTETYLSLRRLENEIIREFYQGIEGQMALGEMADDVMEQLKIRVSIGQFYGIEINDFAVTVAKTALWIAESQMMKETEEIVRMHLDFLPLTSYANIVEGNALRIDWESVVPKSKLNYIMGNPPFVGYSLQSKSQKDDMLSIYVDEKGKPYKTAGKIDYVAGWYFKAAKMMSAGGAHLSAIRTAFVSTNSITQGEQVAGVWKPLFDRFDIHIDFAHRTFRWDSEASLKAHVHCVIVGFSVAENKAPKKLFASDRVQIATNINAYLLEGPDVFIASKGKAICEVPPMVYGNKPTDGGFLFLTPEERNEFLEAEPTMAKFVRQIYGATEYINNQKRYCLWLVGANPADWRKSRFIRERVEGVRNFRLSSTKEATRKSADTPYLFQEVRHPDSEYIIIPRHSSENRRYIPFGFLSSDIVVNDAVQIIPNAELYHFAVMMSNVHMAWVRAVCGRIKSDYRYSKDVVYNNFPWPKPTEAQKAKIEQTAQAILDARALYPDCSLADLYDEVTMPPELRKAHQLNDRAVMQAYGFWGRLNTETECVAELMKLYQELTR